MSKKINEVMEIHLNRLEGPIMEYPWDKPDYYACWLSQTYMYASHTTRLLALAAATCKPAENDFHVRFLEHCKEEKGHEKLVMMDLNSLGKKIEDYPEFTPSAALYQSQYYRIEHESPMAFFGYILALELIGSRFGQRLQNKMEAAHAKNATHFARVHAEDDIDHIEKAFAMIAKIPPQWEKPIIDNMVQTFEHYEAVLKECIHYVQRNKEMKKAA